MSSNARSFGASDTDISQSLMSVEDKHYCVVNERDNFDATSNFDMQNMTEKLIANEAQINMDPVFNAESQSSATVSSVDTKEQKDEENRLGFGAQNRNDSKDATVNELNQKEYDASIDERLPETVTLLTMPDGGKLYLVGTAHFSIESQNDVSMIIQAVQPHMVVMELCKARVGILQLNEEVLYRYAKNLSYQCIVDTLKEYGPYNGLLHILLLRMVARIAKQLKVAPGGEFRRAFEEAKKVPNCIIHLADRPINITILRAVRLLSWWQTFKLGWHLINLKGHISKEDVEVYKQRSLLDDMISKLKEEYPAIEQVFVKERDLYLTYCLQVACMRQWISNGAMPIRVVAIVGMGHTPGIMDNWGKVKPSDIPPIMRVPPQPLSSKILKFTIKASLLSAIVYAGYKIIPLPSGVTLQSIRSSVEGLLKATACADEYEHTIPGVMYVVNNIPGPGVDIEDFESEYSLGCSCTAKCSDCSCTRGSPNYLDGRMLDEKLAGPIIECNSHCACEQNCGNRVVQNGPLDSLIVSEVCEKGLGLFTTKSIKKGQFISEYAGEVIGIDEAKRRFEANKNSMNYVLVVSEHIGDRIIVTCIDPKYFGNIGRYSNHSCEPNANLVPIRVEGVVPRLCLFASRDIEIGEEITFNYAGGVANSVHDLSDTPCLCGSNNCSGYLPHNSI